MHRHAAIRRAHGLTAATFLLVALAVFNYPAKAQTLDATGVRAVPTYESAGLYWSAPGANSTTGCQVKFRVTGAATWTQGLDLWFDSAANECRGSLVGLTAGTSYDVQFNLPGAAASKGLTFSTWSNSKPVASTVTVASGGSTLNITQGGSDQGYVVYDGGGTAVLDANNAVPYNISINASYVIVRRMTLKGAQQHGILISKDVHDVVIEDMDISGWGTTRDGTYGTDRDSGIRANCVNQELTRVTIQRNRIHDPRWPTNSWSLGHPAGPQAVTFSYCGGQNVYRWNEIDGGANHFNDGIGGEDNFSTSGFPNRDSDVYGNKVQNVWDDGLEIEGGNNNVRVWGNYVNNSGTGISSTVTSVGPLYIFRNVWNRNKFLQTATCDSDEKQPLFKSGSSTSFANGRRYLFHNTMLQATQSGCTYGLGGAAGVGGTGNDQLVHNTVSMNNIYHVWKPANSAFYQIGTDNTFQNDMTNASSSPEVSNIVATPTYLAGNGWQSEDGGMYQLAPGTAGYDQGVRIPNFNDSFLGTAPDVGAAESGAPAMKFGIAAASATADTTGTGSGSTPPPSPTPPPTTGTTPVSATMDSSSYTIAAGNSVTFTANVMGNGATPTGTVNFTSDGASIAGCSAAPLSNGRATCTTSGMPAGAHQVKGNYSGDATYGAGVAGPITETVTGVVAESLGMDSSNYNSKYNQFVTFTATVTGNSPTGTMNFTSDGATIAGCGAVSLANGVAQCRTRSLSRGTHAIQGVYSGDANNGAGIAGPITQTVR